MRNFFTPKLTLAVLVLCIIHFHCSKKKVEEKANNIIVQAMVTGRWHLVHFEDNGTPTTEKFNGIEFQFYDNGSVDGISAVQTIRGQWIGDLLNKTIVASFPAGSIPLQDITGTWKITDNDWTNVHATTTAPLRKMHLKKK